MKNTKELLEELRKDPTYGILFKDKNYKEKEIFIKEYPNINVAVSVGPEDGFTLMISGPTLPYLLPLMKIGLEKLGIRVLWVPSYWDSSNIVSNEDIEKLIAPKVIDDLEKFCEVCREKYFGTQKKKIVVYGPSAAGLLALLLTEKYPSGVSGVLCLNTPLGLKNFVKNQLDFVISNYFWSTDFKALEYFLSKFQGGLFAKNGSQENLEYYNKMVEKITQSFLKAKDKKLWYENLEDNKYWKKILSDIENFSEGAKDGLNTPIGQIFEYLRDEVLYYGLEFPKENQDLMKEIYKIWEKSFNIDMRRRFFILMFTPPEQGGFDLSKTSNVTVPVLLTRGGRDAVVPFWGDEDEELTLKNCKKIIFPQAGHAPPTDDPENFITVLKEWLKFLNNKESTKDLRCSFFNNCNYTDMKFNFDASSLPKKDMGTKQKYHRNP